MSPTTWTLLAVAAISVVSLIGALTLLLPALRRHGVLMALVALAAGTLMGDAFLHLLPEAVELWGHGHGDHGHGLDGPWPFVLFGFVALFLLEVGLRWRHAHAEHIDGAHAHEPAAFGWTNLVGDGLHNLLDGAVLATAFLVDPAVGFATTIAVLLHEVPQELGDFAVLLRSGFRARTALLLNLASALLAFLGALVVLALEDRLSGIDRYGLPLIAGAFVYIAAADLIPELHHHAKGRDVATMLGFFLLGILVMVLLGALE